MKLDEKFMATVMAGYDADQNPDDLVPAILVRSCVTVLSVAGAGISMIGELRLPLAASDDHAVRAERLQTTLGEGPCLTATATGKPLVANEETMAASWPMFARELHRQTPYRSVASLPLKDLNQQGLGALDVYSRSEDAFSKAWLEQVSRDIGDPVAAMLFDRSSTAHAHADSLGRGLVEGLDPGRTNVSNRMRIWVAVGMVMEQANLGNADALAALRAYAFSHDATLEDVAAQLTTQRLPLDSVLP